MTNEPMQRRALHPLLSYPLFAIMGLVLVGSMYLFEKLVLPGPDWWGVAVIVGVCALGLVGMMVVLHWEGSNDT